MALLDKQNKSVFFIVLLGLLFVSLFLIFSNHKDKFFKSYSPEYWEKRYHQSQWVRTEDVNPIGDDGLYAYVSWEYVHGKDPSLLNPEIPPLGKYLMGLFIKVFRYKNFFGFLTSTLVLLVFFWLVKMITKSRLAAGLLALIFSLEPLFRKNFLSTNLDSLYLLFFLITLIFYLKKKYLFTGLFAGFFANTKSLVSSVFLVSVVFLVTELCTYLREQDKDLKQLLLTGVNFILGIVIATLASYSVYFLKGNGFVDFLKLQKYILNFYMIGAKGKFANVFSILLLNRWDTWWNGIQKVQSYFITWPLGLLLSAGSVFFIRNNINRRERGLIFSKVWMLIYLLFLSLIPVWPRYLLIYLPFAYLNSFTFLQDLFNNKKKEDEYFKK